MSAEVNNGFIKMVDAIEEKAKAIIPVSENDYIVDGLLYCGKCHTQKQTRVEILGKVRTPMCLCKCATEKRDAERAEFEQMQRELKISQMRNAGFPESDMQQWTFDNDDNSNEKISRVARNYVDKFSEMLKRGKGLLFFGTVGTGKTFISACIANALIDKGHPCMMTNFSRLTNTLQGMFDGKQDYIDNLNSYHLLVIDDLAAERDTEYMNEVVQTIVDSRYRANLPTIITTNLTAEEIKHPADIRKQRTYSRLLEMCVPIEVQGKDRRKNKLKDEHSEMRDLLGF